MANRFLRFFDKTGQPLNFDYVGATGAAPLVNKFNYESNSSSASPSAGQVSLYDISSNIVYFNVQDINGYDITSWANSVTENINGGGKISLKMSFYPSNILEGQISSISIAGSIVTITFSKLIGPIAISNSNMCYCETFYQDLPGGYFEGTIYFDLVSAGLYENQQIFIVQEFIDSVTNDKFLGFPHTGATGTSNSPYWRTRWENDSYGDVDVTDIIFTYQIIENDPDIGGEPSIVNYQNIAYSVLDNPSDYYSNGYVVTPEGSTPSKSMSINVALNAPDVAAEIYERKLIIEDITSGTPEKILEVMFYGQVIGEDERLNVLTNNLGRAFFGEDSAILREHDPNEPFPNYIEINEKRKELMVAGEEIFPYIGSYKGLIGALKFFGYQDLRIKEYWLNLNYNNVSLTPIQENKMFLDNYLNTPAPNQTILIADVLDNENSGKYRLEQTYGPNAQGEYVLDVSSENTLVPSRTYKKTSLFGLYYDLNTVSNQLDDYGYPVTLEAFPFTQEEVLLKLFALKQRLKLTYLPLNARIIDITGEGVYFNVYNTKEWTDVLQRSDFDSGNNVEFKANPDFGFIEDLRAFGTRPLSYSIQAPMNYYDVVDVDVTVVGPSGDVFRFSLADGDNPTLDLEIGKKYYFYPKTSGYDFYLTTDSGLSQVDPLGVEGNGGADGVVSIAVNPQEQSTIYYYSTVNTSKLNGSINVINPEISDLGNIVDPLDSNQQHTAQQNQSLLEAISQFYYLKENGMIENLGDNTQDPIAYVEPTTGEPYKNPIGMPVILEFLVDRWVWDEMSMSWDSLLLPSFSSQEAALTWASIDFSQYNEIEWIIEKPQTQTGSGYYFSFRGYIIDFYKLAHFLPYTGEYNVTCNIYDAFNFKNRKISKSVINVSPRQITIDAWTRYRENEIYTWNQTIRDWDEYEGMWEYPAEGKTYDELIGSTGPNQRRIPAEILDFAIYGNNSVEGQNLQVYSYTDPVGASASFTLSQDVIDISKTYSLLISGSQYSYAYIHTTQPHQFVDGSKVYISGSIDPLNKSWNITIPPGATGYSFQIPYVIVPQSGVGATSGTGSIAGGTALYVLPSTYPSQTVTGGGSISVSVDGRVIGATSSGSNLQSTVNSIIQEINSLYTQPDYFAESDQPDAIPATVSVVADTSSGFIGNGNTLTVELTGSLSLVSSNSTFSGGVTGASGYVAWNPNESDFPVSTLKYFGTKNLVWETFDESTWDESYAHGWEDFAYQEGWLGGYEIHTAKPGDNIKVSTGNETVPFPVGVTFSPSGGTGSTAYITLGDAASQLNSSTDPHITNFYYRVIPSTATASLTTSAPLDLNFTLTSATGGSYPIPSSVPGAPPPLVVSFTVATGP